MAGAPAAAPSAWRNPGCRAHFATYLLAMMADNIEHVISYWVAFQKFNSPALGGFAVVSHWLPFLLFSVAAGGLAERFDPRRLIQLGMLLFMAVSIAWGLLFWTDSLQLWQAMVLLVLHGLAGVLWQTSSQLLLHDIARPGELPGAIRLNAIARNLGFLAGPALGAGLMLWLGPTAGILANALLYAPLLWWLWRAPYGPRMAGRSVAPPRPIRGLADIVQTGREVAANPLILPMVLLAGAVSFLVGNSYHAQMPGYAQDLGHGHADLTYSALLAADAVGALLAGLLLGRITLFAPAPRTALALAAAWALVLAAFALNTGYIGALLLLFCAGFLELSFGTMAQTLVQLNAPAASRGRVIGLFNMAALGLRSFSGITVGVAGSVLGIHLSLGLSAGLVVLVCALLWLRLGVSPPIPPIPPKAS